MINPEHKLALTRQAELLEISRSTVYYRPRPISDADLMLMRRIDELHMNYPFAGSRMLRDMLSQQGLEVGRRHVRTLVRRMAIETLYRKPNTSKPAPGHKIYPYLLRGLSVTRPKWVSECRESEPSLLRRILAKLGANDRTHAVTIAIKRGINFLED
jgi:putative transposase